MASEGDPRKEVSISTVLAIKEAVAKKAAEHYKPNPGPQDPDAIPSEIPERVKVPVPQEIVDFKAPDSNPEKSTTEDTSGGTSSTAQESSTEPASAAVGGNFKKERSASSQKSTPKSAIGITMGDGAARSRKSSLIDGAGVGNNTDIGEASSKKSTAKSTIGSHTDEVGVNSQKSTAKSRDGSGSRAGSTPIEGCDSGNSNAGQANGEHEPSGGGAAEPSVGEGAFNTRNKKRTSGGSTADAGSSGGVAYSKPSGAGGEPSDRRPKSSIGGKASDLNANSNVGVGGNDDGGAAGNRGRMKISTRAATKSSKGSSNSETGSNAKSSARLPMNDGTEKAKLVAPNNKKKKVTRYRYHKRITVRTTGKGKDRANVAQILRKVNSQEGPITPSSIDQLDPEFLMQKVGIKGGKNARWRVRMRQTKRTTENGKTVMRTRVAYRDSDGKKQVKLTNNPICKRCNNKIEHCKCDSLSGISSIASNAESSPRASSAASGGSLASNK